MKFSKEYSEGEELTCDYCGEQGVNGLLFVRPGGKLVCGPCLAKILKGEIVPDEPFIELDGKEYPRDQQNL